MKTTVP